MDRDNNINIFKENARPNTGIYFEKHALIANQPYDIGSIMHYGSTVSNLLHYIEILRNEKNPVLLCKKLYTLIAKVNITHEGITNRVQESFYYESEALILLS